MPETNLPLSSDSFERQTCARFEVILKRKLGALLRERLSNARPGVRMLCIEGGATQG